MMQHACLEEKLRPLLIQLVENPAGNVQVQVGTHDQESGSKAKRILIVVLADEDASPQ